MKKFVSIFLLALYLFGILKSVSPYIEYALNRDYIVENLCINKDKPELECHGKCYLNDRLQEANEENPPHDHAPNPRIEFKENAPAILEEENLHFSHTSKDSQHFYYFSFFTNKHIPDTTTPPPKPYC